ncbi:Uncharacterised protein [Streptococcus pyogenes]|nr:Uncharacterised protein [Streptococcus pyogenes]VHC86721.1 Uncharacterised protein [Streptococcus pyogenes]VHD01752.1 Uncharacterised protein [Streptococcus pyogenes]VHD23773.1 Uncharacterised protein [Streptococcus pyogenes]
MIERPYKFLRPSPVRGGFLEKEERFIRFILHNSAK